MLRVLALDLGRFNKKTHGSIYDQQTGRVQRVSCATNPEGLKTVLSQARELGVTRVVFESQPGAGQVADLVRTAGFELEVANTHADSFKWRAGQSKSDKKDADKLAGLSLRQEIKPVRVPSVPERERRMLIQQRSQLVRHRTRMKNKIRALEQLYWVPMPSGDACWSAAGLASLRALQRSEASPASLRLSLEVLLHRPERSGGGGPGNPSPGDGGSGVGRRIAEALSAWVGDACANFAHARSVGALVGLVPTCRQSGQTVVNGRISKAGSGALRSLLVEGAWVAVRVAPEWKARFLRLGGGAKRPLADRKAIVAIARMLAVTCVALLKTGKAYDPERVCARSAWPTMASPA